MVLLLHVTPLPSSAVKPPAFLAAALAVLLAPGLLSRRVATLWQHACSMFGATSRCILLKA